MNELIGTRIRDHAARLALPHLAENLDGLLDRAETDTMGYLEFVDLLLGEEVGLREGRRFRTALKVSGLPHHKGLDAFDFAFQPDLDPRKIRDLAALEWRCCVDESETDPQPWRLGSDCEGEFAEDRLEPATRLGIVSEFVVAAA
jgi:hypothetical protein